MSESRVLVLVATVPARKRSCERLLAEVARQSRLPDGVLLVLDGYGEEIAPKCTLPVVKEYRSKELTGAGQRWRVVLDLEPEDILLCLDDDIIINEVPHLIKNLVATVEQSDCAAVAMGRYKDGKPAAPGPFARGELIYGAGCSMTVRVKHLTGLQAFAQSVKTSGGPDALGPLGDDDALVSAYLWKQGIKILHVAGGNIYPAPNTQSSSQTAAKKAKRMAAEEQKKEIARFTGWPWPGEFGKKPAVAPPRRPGLVPVRR